MEAQVIAEKETPETLSERVDNYWDDWPDMASLARAVWEVYR